jgi:hypothetical protein
MRGRGIIAALVVAAACGKNGSDQASGKQAVDSTAAPAFTLADFRKLGWLEGAWMTAAITSSGPGRTP